MKIVIQYDPDVSSAPAGFKTAVNEAVAYLDRLVSSNVTFTVEFGWGSSGGLNGNQGDAAISEPAAASIFDPTPQNTTAVVSALTAAYATNGLSGWVTPSVLTADFATTSQFTFFELGYGEAEAMNLLSGMQVGNGTTGLVAMNSTLDWNFDVNGTSNPNFLDAVSALLHEITHDMGRVAGFTSGADTVETLFDMFRYNSSGQLQTAPGGGFFSLNGHVLTLPFEAADMDPADWTDAVAQDSNGFAPFGNAYNYSAVDMLELKALGYQLNAFTNSYLGNAQSEVLIQNTAGAVYVGALSGNALQYTHIGSLVPSQWTFVGSGDFLGDGVSDALIVNTAGLVAVAEDVGGVASYTTVGTLSPSEWHFRGAGDFYGDENNEFLIQSTAGAVYLGNVVSGHASYVQVTTLASEYSFRGVGNFLGDGKDGFLVENTVSNRFELYVGEVGLNNHTTFTQITSPDFGWTFLETGNFLNDGRDDFLIQNAAGAVYAGEVGAHDQTTFTHLTTLSGWKFVGAGDFLGEGHDQFMIENAAGVVDLADWSGAAIHFTQISALSSMWAFH